MGVFYDVRAHIADSQEHLPFGRCTFGHPVPLSQWRTEGEGGVKEVIPHLTYFKIVLQFLGFESGSGFQKYGRIWFSKLGLYSEYLYETHT